MKRLLAITSIAVAAVALFAAAATGRPPSRGAQPGASVETERRQHDLEIAAWSRAFAADSTSALALSQLSGLHLQRARETLDWSDYAEAEALARRSLDLRVRRNGRAFVVLVSSLLAQHRFGEARAAADTLVATFPDEPAYRALLGETQLELGDYAAAEQSFSDLHPYRRHLSIAGRLARFAELTGDLPRARRLLREARAEALIRGDVSAEQRAWFRMRYAEMELRAGRPRTARGELETALAERPDDPRLLAALARLEMARGAPREALRFGERAIGMVLDPAVLGLLAEASRAIGDAAKAAEFEAAMATAVAGQPGAYHRAWSLHLLDRGLDVAAVLARAEAELRVRPDVYGWDVYAWALHKSGRHDEAMEAMDHALVQRTVDPQLYLHAAAIANAAGHASRARALGLRARRLGATA